MTTFIVFGFCASYFFYLKKWADSFLAREYSFCSPSPPEVLPHSPAVSIGVGILWGTFLLCGVFWGFTYIRYPDHLSVHGQTAELFLLILSCASVGLSYFIIYRL